MGKRKTFLGHRPNCYNSGMPNFSVGRSVGENVRNLRVALGSIVRELSRQALADTIAAVHPDKRKVGDSLVERWESGASEPDLHSLRIMAQLAGVTMEQFAFGAPEIDGGTAHVPRPLTKAQRKALEDAKPGRRPSKTG